MTQIASPYKPDLRAMLDNFKAEVFRDLNAHLLGTIVSFTYATTGATATVQPIGRRDLPNGGTVGFPLLTDCPVFMPRGGPFGLNFPVKPGDTCLVLFHDCDIDLWFAKQDTGVPNTDRSHSLSDGLVLVGFNNQPQGRTGLNTTFLYGPGCYVALNEDGDITLFSATQESPYAKIKLSKDGHVVMENSAGASVDLGVDGVLTLNTTHGSKVVLDAGGKLNLSNDSGSLKDSLDNLCNVLKAWVNTGGSTPNPATVTAISQAKTRFDDLLS